MKIMEEKAQECEHLFDGKERKRLQLLRAYLFREEADNGGNGHTESDVDRNDRDMAHQVDQVLLPGKYTKILPRQGKEN